MNSTASVRSRQVYSAALVLVAALTLVAYGQSGCEALDKQNPLLYISSEGVDKGELWLTLHNNTTCSINVETNAEARAWRVLRFADRTTSLQVRRNRTDYDNVSDNEVLTDLIYEIRDARNDRVVKTTSNRHLIFNRRVLAGASVKVAIPLADRQRKRSLVVPFTYEWEEKTPPARRGGAAHQIYFAFRDGT